MLLYASGSGVRFKDVNNSLLLNNSRAPGVHLFSNVSSISNRYLVLSPCKGTYFPNSLAIHRGCNTSLLSSCQMSASSRNVIVRGHLQVNATRKFVFANSERHMSLSSRMVCRRRSMEATVPRDASFSRHPSIDYCTPRGHRDRSFRVHASTSFIAITIPLRTTKRVKVRTSPAQVASEVLCLARTLHLRTIRSNVQRCKGDIFAKSLSSRFFSPNLSKDK